MGDTKYESFFAAFTGATEVAGATHNDFEDSFDFDLGKSDHLIGSSFRNPGND